MKFRKQLRFVQVKKWEQYYIQFKHFKTVMGQIKSEVAKAREEGKSEEDIQRMKNESYEQFKEELTKNVNQIIQFYTQQVTEEHEKIDNLSSQLYDETQKEGTRDPSIGNNMRKNIFGRLLNLYELRTFIEINHTGTRKVIKKFVKKIEMPEVKEDLAPLETECFNNLPGIDEEMSRVEELYILCMRELMPEPDTRQRNELVAELHKQVQNTVLWKQSTVLDNFNAYTFKNNEFHLGVSNIKIIPIIIGAVIFIAFSVYNFFGDGKFEAQRCLGLLLFCAVLWATTAVPLWLTSLSIPFFSVIARLIPGESVVDMAKLIQKSTMSSTVYLIIGGFTIAAAFKQTEMDKRIASMVLSKSTGSVKVFLLVIICLNAFLAMWINNVASTMIVVTLLIPTLNAVSTNSNFAKLILLCIAAGGNFGGVMTPLASPQNAITVNSVENVMTSDTRKPFGFVQFLATAFPAGAVGCVIYWIFIQFLFKNDVAEVPKFQAAKTDFGWRQIVVSIVTVVSIVIWIVLPFGAEDVFGDNGIVGFLPLIIFYGTGILPQSEIANLPWNIIFLVMGGNALGYVVEHSKLLSLVSDLLQDVLGDTSLWVTSLIIALFVIIINIFVSHTVSATILLPIICDFAKNKPNLRLFAMIACVATTSSQILPVSSFPNLCCVSLQDKNGNEYLSTKDVLKSGGLATAISFVLLMSVLYGLGVACDL